jgi:hypothetical protein
MGRGGPPKHRETPWVFYAAMPPFKGVFFAGFPSHSTTEPVRGKSSASPRQIDVRPPFPHRGRASIITVEPAPHAASATAKGSEATTIAK